MPVSADGRFYSGTCYYGASAMALVLMAEAWGYVPVSLVKHFDLFLVSKELADKYQLPSIRPRLEANAHFRSDHRPMTHAQASNLVDCNGTWQALVDGGGETGTAIVDAARQSARLMIANLTRMSSSDERLRCFSGMA
tara:strand:- start:1890 stop:2303 length:414 start_codon:yes stop_codon:yes gene_type:complete